jgi:3-deoxy-manno-octulosonate cytidylyltransferase (CMP-KDO synthetase)
MLKIIGVIPARYGSTRFLGKPLVDIFGKPMIVHTYLNSKKSKLLNKVVVATDDSRIESVIKNIGGEVILTPIDFKSGSDRVAYCLNELQCDIVVNIQGDEPFINSDAIDAAIKPLINDTALNVSTLIKKIDDYNAIHDSNIVKVVKDINNYALYFSRSPIPFIRDEKEYLEYIKKEVFYKHIGLYVYRSDFLKTFVQMAESLLENCEKLEQLRILENGYRIKCVLTDYETISVDTIDDLNRITNFNNR